MNPRFEFIRPDGTPLGRSTPLKTRTFRSPIFGFLGLRPLAAQHTREEDRVLRRAARDRGCVVEIGVGEGAASVALRSEMARTGTLYLIDPFHLARWRFLNGMKWAARRAVNSVPRGRVVWIEKFSEDAARNWNAAIDFLFIDGDHSREAVARDWSSWSRFVEPGGRVAFHDARVYPGGWTARDWGPVQFVDRHFRNRPPSGWVIVDEVHSTVVVERVS